MFQIVKTAVLLVPFLYLQACAVLTPSQVNAVGSFASAAENYADLPAKVTELHAHIMFAENIYASASLMDSSSAPNKISRDVDKYMRSLHTSAKAYAALNILDSYVELLKKLSSAEFTEKLEQETAILATEIDGGVSQYNEVSGEEINAFGSAVAESVRSVGGVITRYKQAQALKDAVTGAEPAILKISASVTGLMDLYICGAVDDHGVCVVDGTGNTFPGFGELVEQGLEDEYQGLLSSGMIDNSVEDIQTFTELLLKAKSIKPLAMKTKQAMLAFQIAHTKLYAILQERQTLVGTIEEVNTLYARVKSAQSLQATIENPGMDK